VKHAAIGIVLYARPDAEYIFEGEDEDGKDLECLKEWAVCCAYGIDRSGHGRADIEDDEPEDKDLNRRTCCNMPIALLRRVEQLPTETAKLNVR
jgi:hypothetical protein